MPAGDNYQAVITGTGNLRVYDRNKKDLERGPYWSAFEAPMEEDTTSRNVAGAYPIQGHTGQVVSVRRRFDPRKSQLLSKFDLAISSPRPDSHSRCQLSVYRGGLDSTDLLTTMPISVDWLSEADMKTKRAVQTFTLKTSYLMQANKTYTFEVSVPGGEPGPALLIGCDKVLTPTESRDEHICFTDYLQPV